jgi:signal transduction histidine kinase
MTGAEMRVVETEWEGAPALLAVLRDCTERKRAEAERAQLFREQLARAEPEQALRERDAFLAVASHELKTPLSTLSGTAQLLRRQVQRQETVEREQVRAALARMDEQAHRLARLVSRLLDIADINAGTLGLARRRIDLVPLVAGVVTERQGDHGPARAYAARARRRRGGRGPNAFRTTRLDARRQRRPVQPGRRGSRGAGCLVARMRLLKRQTDGR